MTYAPGMSRPTRSSSSRTTTIFRETLELLLGLRGDIEVVGSVGSGQEAVERVRERRPDVVLVDYRMPGLNGAQTTDGDAAGLAARRGSSA